VRDTFSLVALKLVIEQPFKIPFVAGVVLYANAEKPEVAKEVVEKAGLQLQEQLDAGKWREVKLTLRFVASLSPLYEQDGVLPILDELFNRAADLQTASQEDALGLELVKIILLTVPYLLAANKDAALQQSASELLERTGIITSTQSPLEPLVDPYPDNGQDEKPMACASVISMLQQQLQEEESNGWPLACIPKVYDPSLKAPQANGNGELDAEIESVPPTSVIASCLLRDAILDTVNILDFNRNATARFLNEIDCYWAPDTFVKRSTAFDKLRDMPAGKPTWKPEDVAIDAIFSQIFQLPTPEHRLVYYHSLITESCKISPGAIAPSLGRAIRFLFRSVDAMDMELNYRFMDWFAHHLSNFEFRWKWAEWYCTSSPSISVSY
jgi:nuclear cap-binding protein subunit 1